MKQDLRGIVRKRKEYYEYPLRTCLYMNECAVCGQRITSGQKYYDGGYNRRCHIECAPPQYDEGSVDRCVCPKCGQPHSPKLIKIDQPIQNKHGRS